MTARQIREGIYSVGAVDWDRRLFDSLIPLPDGTSYNSYLVKGSQKAALLDTVEPAKASILFENLKDFETIDYVISHHSEQDHSGTIPAVLARYPEAVVVCSSKAKGILTDHLDLPESKIRVVADGDTLSLGNRTFEFAYTPWVHWPETMCSFLREDRILFSCDFFGSHVAQSDLYARDEGLVHEAAKRYYAETLMPFRTAVRKDIDRIKGFPIEVIAPGHGPIYSDPAFIINAYQDWAADLPKSLAVIVYATMHHSTELMVARLADALAGKGVGVCRFNMADSDVGKLAISLVDAATIVIASPCVHIGLHPRVASAVFLANCLRPKARFAAIIGSYGWGHKIPEQVASMIPNLKVEILPPLIVRGLPRESDLANTDALAETIASKHREIGASRLI
jgi:flavorubredoxin